MEEGVVDLHFFTGSGVLKAFDDNAVAGLETTGDDPAIVLRRAQFNRLLADPLLVIEQQHLRHPGAVTLDGPLRHADALLIDRLLQAHAHETARQQVEVRIREFAAQDDLPGAWIDRDVGEQQLARQRVQAAVVLDQRGPGLSLTDCFQLTGAERPAQVVEFAGRLGEVGVDRVQLLYQRQRRGFVLPHQRAFGHQGATDAPGDRCGNGGVPQVERCPVHRGLVGGDVGRRLSHGSARVVVVLAADGLVVDQLGVALRLQSGLVRIGLGLAQCRFGAFQVGLERGRVDAKQHIAFLHVAAFAEGALQHHAGHAGPHFSDAWRHDPSAQFTADRQRSGFDGFDANGGQRCLFFGVGGLVAGAQRQRQRYKTEPGKRIFRHE